VWKIEKVLVVQLLVPVPVTAPADLDSHFSRDAQDKPPETVERFSVVPPNVRGLFKSRYNVSRRREGFSIMLTMGVLKLGTALAVRPALL